MSKLFWDPVHGVDIKMEAGIMCVINTPQFQRLRLLKQLGACLYIYPTAVHTRFEHSLGVAYLTGLIVRHFQKTQPDLEITEKDYYMAKIFGLCHDLGHGPLSHTFEKVMQNNLQTKWNHEEMSGMMWIHLVETNDLETKLQTELGFTRDDIDNIGRLIQHLPVYDKLKWIGEIVASSTHGIDADRLDYFLRDSKNLYTDGPMNYCIKTIINSSRLINGEICFEEKMALQLQNVFSLRAHLHKFAYQHHSVVIYEEMIQDVFNLTFPILLDFATMSEIETKDAITDPYWFSKLNDGVLSYIQHVNLHFFPPHHQENLLQAKNILNQIDKRAAYEHTKLVDLNITKYPERWFWTENQIKSSPYFKDIDSSAFSVRFIQIHYGSVDSKQLPDNPLLKIKFFNPKINKHVINTINEEQMSLLFTPRCHGEKLVMIIVKKINWFNNIKTAFDMWSTSLQLHTTIPCYNKKNPCLSKK